MKTPTRNESAAMAQATSKAEEISEAETNRADWWTVIPLSDRLRAMGVAGLTKERASAPFASFTNGERELIRVSLSIHISRMETIMRCMNDSNTNAFGWLH